MINIFNSNLNTNKINPFLPTKKRMYNTNLIQNFSEITPSFSFNALASQVKAMAEVDNNSPLGARLNILA